MDMGHLIRGIYLGLYFFFRKEPVLLYLIYPFYPYEINLLNCFKTFIIVVSAENFFFNISHIHCSQYLCLFLVSNLLIFSTSTGNNRLSALHGGGSITLYGLDNYDNVANCRSFLQRN